MKLLRSYHIMTVLTALIVVTGLAAIYLYFWDGKIVNRPIKFISDSLAIQTVDIDGNPKSVFHPGETVYGYFEYCKLRNIPVKIQWTLIDHTLTFFTPRIASTGKGCHEIASPLETIEPNTPPDPLVHFEGTLQYPVNALSSVTVPLKTQDFIISYE